jgi:hypothetical protein
MRVEASFFGTRLVANLSAHVVAAGGGPHFLEDEPL